MLDREVAFNQQINAVTPRIGDPHFWFGQIRAAKRLVQMASTESMKGMVSKTRFAAIRVMKPPDELQRRFAELSLRLRYLSEPNRAASTRTNSLFASIQERAFRGEL